jgi:diguanylate cyclase (GGDEF)-like protein
VSASLAFFLVLTAVGRDLTPTPETSRDRRFAAWTAHLAVAAVVSLPLFLIAAALSQTAPSVILRYRMAVTALALIAMMSLLLRRQRRLHEELERANKTLEEASLNDPLTGIYNRRYFQAIVERDVAQSLRAYATRSDPRTRDLIFYMVDLDDFKQVNDQIGHDAGDQVLIDVSRRIYSAIRGTDVVMRWGGEEFLIVSRGDRREATVLAGRVLQAVGEMPIAIAENRWIRCTCSIGWAPFPWFAEHPRVIGHDKVVNIADQALRKAKNAGKNRAFGITPSEVGDYLPEETPQHIMA